MLESEGVTIGAVTGVQGISWQELTITGQSNHAGTTPIELRHDAGLLLIGELRDQQREGVAAHARQHPLL